MRTHPPSLASLHWSRHANQWSLIGSPLRPCSADTAHYANAIDTLRRSLPGAILSNALLLGVTPEIADLQWPPETRLTAVDLALPMIENVWPGNHARRCAVRADWLALPFADQSIDCVIGDGCLALLEYPTAWQRFAKEMRRCLSKNGQCMLRAFCRPDESENVEAIVTALRGGRIGSFHALKWRLAMAMQGKATERGIALANIWNAFQKLAPDRTALAHEQSWPVAEIDTIDAYRDNPARLHFPSLDEVRAALCTDLKEVECRICEYELAECCPHLLLRPYQT